MFRFLAGIAAALWLLIATGASADPPAPRRGGNPAAAKIVNPVAATPESIASGRRTYRRLCTLCHGPEGRGDGGGAGGGGVPADLTADKWRYGGSDGELFAVIYDGVSTDMQGYAEQLSDTEIWNLVNYIRTLAHRGA